MFCTVKSLRYVSIIVLLFVCSVIARAGDETSSATLSADEEKALGERLGRSIVYALFDLQSNMGETGCIEGLAQRCPNCGSFHGAQNVAKLIRDERPLEVVGFLIDAETVVIRDPIVPERFIQSVRVRLGKETVPARIAYYGKEKPWLGLHLEKPLKSANPLVFHKKVADPYYFVSVTRPNTRWILSIRPFDSAFVTTEEGRCFRMLSVEGGLVVNREGIAVGFLPTAEVPPDDSWKGSPLESPCLTTDELNSLLANTQTLAERSLLATTLKFRSPKKEMGESWRYRRYSDDDEEDNKTERHTVALVVDAKRILVPIHLSSNVTARLERIEVKTPDGRTLEAKFEASLKDYGAFTAALNESLGKAVKGSDQDVREYRDALLPLIDIRVQGEDRTMYRRYTRFRAFDEGWRGQIYPVAAFQREESPLNFVFNCAGEIISLPMFKRLRAGIDGRSYRSQGDEIQVPVAYVNRVLADLKAQTDPNNIPLSETEENRIAWLGVEIQPLDSELARVNKVSDLTRDGKSGALVSYVYPSSPAARMGIEPGIVLLRVHCAQLPKPYEICEGESERSSWQQDFPWDRYDEIPVEYLSNAPLPWPTVESPFNLALTGIGFGAVCELEYFAEGKTQRKSFTIEQSPPHYNSAPRFKSERLGVTVCDVTFEVRRYFQRVPEDPGVIVSKIEPGQKAAVAGLRPYEIVTHVNGKPVRNVEEFRKLADTDQALKLSVKRMDTGRIVQIKAGTQISPTPAPEAEVE